MFLASEGLSYTIYREKKRERFERGKENREETVYYPHHLDLATGLAHQHRGIVHPRAIVISVIAELLYFKCVYPDLSEYG